MRPRRHSSGFIFAAAFAVSAAVATGGVGALADELGPQKKLDEAALAKLEHEGPPPTSSAQRFIPNFMVAPPLETPSPAPKKSEWTDAPDALDVRVTDPNCRAQRLREWYRVTCPPSYVSMVTGTREGVEVGPGANAEGNRASAGYMVFPARRGDRRLFLMLFRAKWSLAPDVIVSEQWLDGDPAPMVTVTGIPG